MIEPLNLNKTGKIYWRTFFLFFREINEILNDFPKDKLIIVSQWTSMLGIIARQLKKQSIEYCEIKGEVSLAKRNEIVESFNSKSNNDLKGILTYFFLFAHHKKYVFILKKLK